MYLFLWSLLSALALAEVFCATNSNVTLYDPGMNEPQIGGASLLQPYFRQPWPRFPGTKAKFRVIRYCYANQAAREALECSSIRPALKVWREAIGEVASASTGHSIAWKEIIAPPKNKGDKWQPRYCFAEGTKDWHPSVAGDTLAIHLVEGASPQSSVGYTRNGEPGRHKLILPYHPSRAQVVHEIGHVLGMIHEQCRNDRDSFLKYTCKNVRGFDRASTDAILAGETNVPTRLCEDQAFAMKYGFDGSQFTKNAGYVDFAGRSDEGKFDFGSVMMYPSNAFSNPECSPTKMDACPMVAIDRINVKEVGTSWIYSNVAPSNGDVAFVKKWYPWGADMNIGGEAEVESSVREHRSDVGKLRAARGD